MNYRHAYHAGNFADVLKHAVLALVIEHLKLKPAPFRVIDTHAGIGRYDLAGMEAGKTGEWRSGIGQLLESRQEKAIEAILAPYLGVVRDENRGVGADLTVYPGSPLIARRLLRRGDQLVVNELHPEDHAALAALFASDPQTKVLHLDAWIALKSLLPPKERRGLVLVDPPFEDSGELDRLVAGVAAARHRFATGTIMLWLPIKEPAPINAFYRKLEALALDKLLIAELFVRKPSQQPGLAGTALVIFNPPYTLHRTLEVLLPWLAGTLGQGPGASWRLILNST